MEILLQRSSENSFETVGGESARQHRHADFTNVTEHPKDCEQNNSLAERALKGLVQYVAHLMK